MNSAIRLSERTPVLKASNMKSICVSPDMTIKSISISVIRNGAWSKSTRKDESVIPRSPVRFRSHNGATALPVPLPGGSIVQLRQLVELDRPRIRAARLGAGQYTTPPFLPHPIFHLVGEEGSAKTIGGQWSRALVDPCKADARRLPIDIRDLMAEAYNSYLLVFDNASTITRAMSDALCQVTSGSGLGQRKLYTTTEQVLIDGSRPVFVTGLHNVVTVTDLADRLVVVRTNYIKSDVRQTVTNLRNAFSKQRPLILGALLDAVVCGLKTLSSIKLTNAPRLADFATWAIACEKSFAKPGDFLVAFAAMATEASDAVIENDPVATAIGAFMADRDHWAGTAAGLLAELNSRDRSEAAPSHSKSWPREASIFSMRLRGATAVLRKAGIEVAFGKAASRQRTRTVTLRRIATQSPAHRPADKPSAPDTSDTSDTETHAGSNVTLFRERPKNQNN